MILERILYDRGKVWAEWTAAEAQSRFRRDPDGDPVYPLTEADGMTYRLTQTFTDFFHNEPVNPADLSGYDLEPSTKLWVGVGGYRNKADVDLLFKVESSAHLRAVAAYYKLPFPLSAKQVPLADGLKETVARWTLPTGPVLLASVRFVAGKPTLLRVHTAPRAFGTWRLWMRGMAFSEGGKCVELGDVRMRPNGGRDDPAAHNRGQGASRFDEKAESTRLDGTKVQWLYLPNMRDPLVQWFCVENPLGGAPRTREFYATRWITEVISGMSETGVTLEEFPLFAGVEWLGKAEYPSHPELGTELFYAIFNAGEVPQACAHYNVPLPHNQALSAKLADPNSIRFRHYEFDEAIPLPIAIGSILFDAAKQPVGSRLYAFVRPWEDDWETPLGAYYEAPTT